MSEPTALESELVKALKEADAFIRDLVVLLKPPVGKRIEFVRFASGREMSQEEAIDHTVEGALDFLDKLDIRSYVDPAS